MRPFTLSTAAGRQQENDSGFRYELFDETTYARYHVVIKAALSTEPSGGAESMHIPDGMLDSSVAIATGVAGAGGLLVALRQLERRLGERTTVLMGTMSAFVFAAQMVNFPAGPGVSGHLLGGVLAAVLLGPWAGAVVIAAVLLVQCFLFADGGFTALGANFVNMGLIGAVAGYAVYAPLCRWIGGRRGILIAAMVAAWFSVLLAAGAVAVELAFSRGVAVFLPVLSWLALVHVGIGLGEAIITGMIVRFLLVRRPDLIEAPDDSVHRRSAAGRWGQTLSGGLAVALAIAVFLAPFASQAPDGLEFVGEKLGLSAASSPAPPLPAPIPEYQLHLPGLRHVKLATAAAGVVGTLVVFGFAWGMARVLTQSRSREATPDAA
jgi:cobalt/nickel transport system permease protein